jgi:uncharacterized phage protein (TIGR02216 family)
VSPPPTRAAQPFPWNDATALAFGLLRWSPDQFWRATPRELAAAFEGLFPPRAEPASRADLARLMGAFPDGA